MDTKKLPLGAKLKKLAKTDPEKYKEILTNLSDDEREDLWYNPEYWLRDNQKVNDEWPEPIIMFFAGRGFGKDLIHNTPILTTNKGFVPIGEIVPGDEVYAWDGTPTKVLNTYRPEPRQLVEFTFSDGEKITSSVEHDWVTWTHRDRKQWYRKDNGALPSNWPSFSGAITDSWGNTKDTYGPSVKTTQEIIDTFRQNTKRKDLNHSIPLSCPLEGEYDSNIVDPYYLGYWLGDGHSHAAHSLACGDEDSDALLEKWPEFKYVQKCHYRGDHRKFSWLKRLGVVNNKHIPDCVFKASLQQRLDVLRGLMDSDGYAGNNNSHVEFCSTRKVLAEGVLLLARTLGQKPVLSEGAATIDGRYISQKYRVTWRPTQNINPFLLKRKADKITFGNSQEARNHQRMIVSWRYVDYEPTVCIEVDHEDHLFLAGEALIPTHNTYALVSYLRRKIKEGAQSVAIIAPTSTDLRNTIVEDGILLYSHPEEAPLYEPSKSRVVWPSGSVAKLFSAEKGQERVRGGNNEILLIDELGSIDNKDVFDQAMFTLRIGESRCVIATTPRATETIIDLYNRAVFNDEESKWSWDEDDQEWVLDKDVRIITGSTYDNIDNLSRAFKSTIINAYEGTRLGDQELLGKLLLANPGALWTPQLISDCTLGRNEESPEIVKVSIGVDPASTKKRTSDSTGIVVVGITEEGTAIVLSDHTKKYSTQGWVNKVLDIYDSYAGKGLAVTIVVERNQGGDMVKEALTRERTMLPVEDVFATQSKLTRAGPVALLYEQGKIQHVRGLTKLEGEMTTYDGTGKSPDRLDAMVYAVLNLIPVSKGVMKVFQLNL